ncbi:acyltransferase family protein [Streptosporangium sp. 'caverna']|uniref:acyltransferase family protein n=1 Tax=Streptosporangium sp. 'caverna' TaxID=2202249 RepID=UPI00195501C0|nr:acyltransferase family protein [Streptosporangium sp. 'caverna']
MFAVRPPIEPDPNSRGPADGEALERMTWPDVAKGACILLVVLWHVIMKHYLQIDWHLPIPVPGAWGTVTEQLLPLRMPLFFTISGMFAIGAVNRPWRVLGRSKVAGFLYLYVLWLLIHTVLLALVPDFDTARADGPLGLLAQLTITPSNLWYLYALALYFAIAKVVRRLPAGLVVGAAFILSAAASAGLLEMPGDRGGVYKNLVFFLAGMYFRPIVERLAAVANRPRLAVLGVSYIGILAAMAVTGADTWPGVWPLACVLAAVLGVTAAVLVSRWVWLGNRLAALGRGTLPIYVMHMPLLALLHRALVPLLSVDMDGRLRLVLAVVEPVILSAVVVWLCRLLYRALVKMRAGWLFELPWAKARDSRTPPFPVSLMKNDAGCEAMTPDDKTCSVSDGTATEQSRF